MGDSLANPSSIAALNQMAALGGGYPTAFLGSSADSLQRAFQQIVGDIQAKTSAASSVALNTGSWTTGSAIYQAKFNSSDWSGTLAQLPRCQQRHDRLDADLGRRRAGQGAELEQRPRHPHLQAVRRCRARMGFRSAGLPQRRLPNATELDTSQTTALNQTPGGRQRLRSASCACASCAAMRATKRATARRPPCAAPQFRNRAISPLGDVINSSPYYVGTPNFGYYDDFEAVRYSSFVASYRSRTPGHLHGR